MSKTALVVGATGVVGRELVQQLANADHIEKVISFSRRAVNYQHDKIENQVVDYSQLEKYADLFKGDLLFSALGTTKKQAGSIAAQRIVDYDYQLLAAELAAANGVPHYLLVSSSAANAKSHSPYLKMKGQLEETVTALAFDRVSIFQPSLLVGERQDARIGEEIGNLILPAICKLPGLKKYRPIRGDQVAAKMVDISNSEGTGVQRYVLDEIFVD